jgi:polygalacturonase
VTIVILLPVHLSWRDPQLKGISLGGITNVWARPALSVKKYGAKGDGLHNDSGAISAAFAAARSGDVISFPAGVYICNDVNVVNKSNLTLKGQGNSTIIRNGSANGATPLLTFATVNGLTIQDLSFDNRSIGAYGGVRFYDTENVLINRTRFFDSAPLPLGSTDRYSYVFGNGTRPHKNIRITNNAIDDLQLEVDFGQGGDDPEKYPQSQRQNRRDRFIHHRRRRRA